MTLTPITNADTPFNVHRRNPLVRRVVTGVQDNTAAKHLLLICINLFIAATIFDPADKVSGLKIPLFCACWVLVGLACLASPQKCRIPGGLAGYTFTMILVPVLSIGYYLLVDGRQPFEGFAMAKAYIFITFAILLYLAKIDFLASFSRILTLLALCTIAVYLISLVDNGLVESWQVIGGDYGITNIASREYIQGVKTPSIYFVTSPMLVVSLAYYFNMALTSLGRSRYFYGLLAAVNAVGMFLGGTRNNMWISILLPAVLIVFRSKKKILLAPLVAAIVIIVAANYWGEIMTMLSAGERSNNIKIAYLRDYDEIFRDPVKLLFGEGLGAYHYWTAKSYNYYVTELTYLEIFRNFGLMMGTIMLGLLLYPIYSASVVNPTFPQQHMIIAYVFYLVACMTNPLFFSSMGMSLLSVLLANIFMFRHGYLRVHN